MTLNNDPTHLSTMSRLITVVRPEGVIPPLLAAQDPESCAHINCTTPASKLGSPAGAGTAASSHPRRCQPLLDCCGAGLRDHPVVFDRAAAHADGAEVLLADHDRHPAGEGDQTPVG